MATSDEFKQELRVGNFTKALKMAVSEAIELKITTWVASTDDDMTGLETKPKPGSRMRTRINIVDGDIDNEIGTQFVGDGPYSDLRSFHLEQVRQGRETIQKNLLSLQRLFSMFGSALQSPSTFNTPTLPGSATPPLPPVAEVPADDIFADTSTLDVEPAPIYPESESSLPAEIAAPISPDFDRPGFSSDGPSEMPVTDFGIDVAEFAGPDEQPVEVEALSLEAPALAVEPSLSEDEALGALDFVADAPTWTAPVENDLPALDDELARQRRVLPEAPINFITPLETDAPHAPGEVEEIPRSQGLLSSLEDNPPFEEALLEQNLADVTPDLDVTEPAVEQALTDLFDAEPISEGPDTSFSADFDASPEMSSFAPDDWAMEGSGELAGLNLELQPEPDIEQASADEMLPDLVGFSDFGTELEAEVSAAEMPDELIGLSEVASEMSFEEPVEAEDFPDLSLETPGFEEATELSAFSSFEAVPETPETSSALADLPDFTIADELSSEASELSDFPDSSLDESSTGMEDALSEMPELSDFPDFGTEPAPVEAGIEEMAFPDLSDDAPGVAASDEMLDFMMSDVGDVSPSPEVSDELLDFGMIEDEPVETSEAADFPDLSLDESSIGIEDALSEMPELSDFPDFGTEPAPVEAGMEEMAFSDLSDEAASPDLSDEMLDFAMPELGDEVPGTEPAPEVSDELLDFGMIEDEPVETSEAADFPDLSLDEPSTGIEDALSEMTDLPDFPDFGTEPAPVEAGMEEIAFSDLSDDAPGVAASDEMLDFMMPELGDEVPSPEPNPEVSDELLDFAISDLGSEASSVETSDELPDFSDFAMPIEEPTELTEEPDFPDLSLDEPTTGIESAFSEMAEVSDFSDLGLEAPLLENSSEAETFADLGLASTSVDEVTEMLDFPDLTIVEETVVEVEEAAFPDLLLTTESELPEATDLWAEEPTTTVSDAALDALFETEEAGEDAEPFAAAEWVEEVAFPSLLDEGPADSVETEAPADMVLGEGELAELFAEPEAMSEPVEEDTPQVDLSEAWAFAEDAFTPESPSEVARPFVPESIPDPWPTDEALETPDLEPEDLSGLFAEDSIATEADLEMALPDLAELETFPNIVQPEVTSDLTSEDLVTDNWGEIGLPTEPDAPTTAETDADALNSLFAEPEEDNLEISMMESLVAEPEADTLGLDMGEQMTAPDVSEPAALDDTALNALFNESPSEELPLSVELPDLDPSLSVEESLAVLFGEPAAPSGPSPVSNAAEDDESLTALFADSLELESAAASDATPDLAQSLDFDLSQVNPFADFSLPEEPLAEGTASDADIADSLMTDWPEPKFPAPPPKPKPNHDQNPGG